MKPGEILYATQPVTINAGRRTLRLRVHNTGDRPIQVGSHFHFFEVNRALDFEREQALGMRLNILAATSVRFEPGDEREVELVEIGGMQRLVGFNGLVNGAITARWTVREAIQRARDLEFSGAGERWRTAETGQGSGSEEEVK